MTVDLTVVAGIHPVKSVKDLVQVVLGDADTFVNDVDGEFTVGRADYFQ